MSNECCQGGFLIMGYTSLNMPLVENVEKAKNSQLARESYTTAAEGIGFVVALPPRPRPLPKNRKLGIDIWRLGVV
jgi:hypothetical protein